MDGVRNLGDFGINSSSSVISSEASTEVINNTACKVLSSTASAKAAHAYATERDHKSQVDQDVTKLQLPSNRNPKKVMLPPSFFSTTTPQSPTSPPKVTRRSKIQLRNYEPRSAAVTEDDRLIHSSFNVDTQLDMHSPTKTLEYVREAIDVSSINTNKLDSKSNLSAEEIIHSNSSLSASGMIDSCQSQSNDSGTNEENFQQSETNALMSHQIVADEMILRTASDSSALYGSGIRQEEEATPEQTAFGKELLFRRVLRSNRSKDNDDESGCSNSDVLSTVSEMGTVIDVDLGVPSRMDDVDEMLVTSSIFEVNLIDNETLNSKPAESMNEEDAKGGNAPVNPSLFDHRDNAIVTSNINLELPDLEDALRQGRLKTTAHFPRKRQVKDDSEIEFPHEEGKLSNVSTQGPLSPDEQPQIDNTGVTASNSIFSIAMRRIGSNFVNNGQATTSFSAPTTPRRTRFSSVLIHPKSPSIRDEEFPINGSHMVNQQTRVETDDALITKAAANANSRQKSALPSLLRSPGASSRFASHPVVENRRRQAFRDNPGSFSRSLLSPADDRKYAKKNGVDSNDDKFNSMEQLNPMRIARSCFSFDAYDTAVDDHYEIYSSTLDTNNVESSFAPGGHVKFRSAYNDTFSKEFMLGHNGGRHQKRSTEDFPIMNSASWDGIHLPKKGFDSSAKYLSSPLSQRSSRLLPVRVNRLVTTPSHFQGEVASQQLHSSNQSPPQRIEVEREDALDILACLVERGISLKQEFDSGEKVCFERGQQLPAETKCEGDSSSKLVDNFRSSVRELEALSLAQTAMDDKCIAHERRQRVLAELLRSHEYAVEMKRASRSASLWLNSIGRFLGEESSVEGNSEGPIEADTLGLQSKSVHRHEEHQPTSSSNSLSDCMDLLTMKAMLNAALLEAKEKDVVADRLNEELAMCRAEIGRLKSTAQVSAFRSPNRSILDMSDDISVTEVDNEDEIDVSFDNASPIPEVNESVFTDGSFDKEDESDHEKSLKNSKDPLLLILWNELNDANKLVQKLQTELETHSKGHQMPLNNNQLLTDQNMERIRKGLDDDNFRLDMFESDWKCITNALPNPPSHGLQSPLVSGVLQKWTDDLDLHASFLKWMEQVLAGSDTSFIPPLTLSCLDHHVRDGFILHILPILLRRPDVRVDVKSRTRIQSSYDLSVEVSSSDNVNGNKLIMNDKIIDTVAKHRNLETTSMNSDIGISCSSTTQHSETTDVRSNTVLGHGNALFTSPNADYNRRANASGNRRDRVPTRSKLGSSTGMSYDEMVEDNNTDIEVHAGFMNTIGDLFTRRLKQSPLNASSIVPMPENSPVSFSVPDSSPASELASLTDIDGNDLEVNDKGQPYHRVVMAPSGRIGVTFVEYRGHCMVSDVAVNSPLVGWIYPSDILIAIDSLPVSGMRVRDIIKILKDKQGQQRAMRVISGHAMNELTLVNASIIVDPNS